MVGSGAFTVNSISRHFVFENSYRMFGPQITKDSLAQFFINEKVSCLIH